MKKQIIISTLLVSTLSFGFDLKNITSELTKNIPNSNQSSSQNQNLDNSTISNGLKEALKQGVNYATSSLGAENGYLNNKNAKIPLPQNLANIEGLIRKSGGDKMADDLINSMNKAASKAAPKTAQIFMNSISKMSLNDAQTILNGKNNSATEYFKKSSSSELKAMIKPIIQESMKENNVAQYYDLANNFFQSSTKSIQGNPLLSNLAKTAGLSTDSNESLDDYITSKAMDGLFSMIAQKEANIRENPLEQTSSILKQVFGK